MSTSAPSPDRGEVAGTAPTEADRQARADRLFRQAGITNRPPEHVIVAAFRLDTVDPAATRAALEDLRTIERLELRSDLDAQDPTTPKDAPSPETGELGFRDGYDRGHLTITTGFAVGTYDKLGLAAELRPQDLVAIDWAQLGDGPAQPDQGDLVLQVCSDDAYVAEHVVRRVETDLAGRVKLLWAQVGSQRYTTRQGRTSRAEGRALNGFLDGTSNLDPRHSEADTRLVFVEPADVAGYPTIPADQPAGYGGAPGTAFPPDLRHPPAMEPPSCRNGTYMVVRASVVDLTAWDHVTLAEQEQTIGRFKHSGAFLDTADDPARLNDAPDFASNPANTTVALDSHARKVNPRRPEDIDRRLFRRGYPLIAPSPTGLDRGLLFIAYGRTISTQFEFVFRAWMRNPNFPNAGSGPDRLFAFENRVIAGGYYFVPPLSNGNRPWTWVVPE